jgi:hypothetical protein
MPFSEFICGWIRDGYKNEVNGNVLNVAKPFWIFAFSTMTYSRFQG